MSDWWELCWWAGTVLATLALGVVALALFRDRSRGRRRCPGCWYDMAGVNGMRCPECGRTQRKERRFFRTRRRWRRVLVGVVLLLVGAGSALAPAIYAGTWTRYTPTPVLRTASGFFKGDAGVVRANFDAMGLSTLTPWERVLLASSLAESIREELEKPPPARASSDDWAFHTRRAPSPLTVLFRTVPVLEDDARLVMPELALCLLSGRDGDAALTAHQHLGEIARANEGLIEEMLRDERHPELSSRLVQVLDAMGARGPRTLESVRRFAARRVNDGRRLEAVSAMLLFGMYEENQLGYLAELIRTGWKDDRLISVSILGRLAHSRDNTRVSMGTKWI